MSKPSRFTDLKNEPIDHLLTPISGYLEKPLVSLSEAVEPVSGFFKDLDSHVFVALHNCQSPADELTQDESAAIHLYTMQFDSGPSVFEMLNKSLRAENRGEIKPWFSYLKLFLTALHKLPSERGTVWRGIRDVNLTSKYKNGTKFAWWGVNSCTTQLGVLESEQFLGKQGERTLFSIDCINGKSIIAHSYFKDMEEEVILMPGSYFEVIGKLNPAPELYIIQLKEITPPIPLVKPPFEKQVQQVVQKKAKMQQYNMEQQEKDIIKKRLIIGNTAKLSSTNDKNGRERYEWILFIKFENDHQNEIGEFIKQVIVDLHPSFNPPRIVLDKLPFQLKRVGWGTFEINLSINFHSKWNKPNLKTSWELSFESPASQKAVDIEF